MLTMLMIALSWTAAAAACYPGYTKTTPGTAPQSCRYSARLATAGKGLTTPLPCCVLCPLQTIKLWWGYLRIEASGSQLKCEAVSDLNGSVMDAITLVKSDGWAERYMQAAAGRHHESGAVKRQLQRHSDAADGKQKQQAWQWWQQWQPRWAWLTVIQA